MSSTSERRYALLAVWNVSGGAHPQYVDSEVLRAAVAGAPAGVIYRVRTNGQRLISDRPTWIDAVSEDRWALWDDLIPADTIERMEATARRMFSRSVAELVEQARRLDAND